MQHTLEQTIGNIDLLDYGARMYDTKTVRWLVQDPLAEKYYSVSSYNYCVNNPVMFVDPDGKKIKIGNSELQDIEKNGTEYEKQVYKDLIELINMNKELSRHIKSLADSKYIIQILDTKERPLDKDGKTNNGNAFVPSDSRSNKYIPERGVYSGGNIYYNPYNKFTNQGEERDPIIGLAHEIGHAYNAITGKRVVYDQDLAEDGNDKHVILGNSNEKSSIYLENIVRRIKKLKERSYEYYKKK